MDKPDNDLFSGVNWGKQRDLSVASLGSRTREPQYQGSGSLEKAGRCIYSVWTVQLSVCRTIQTQMSNITVK